MGNFKEIIQQDTPVLVDFFATWCSPCKSLSIILEEIKKELGDRVTILKIDVDKNSKAASVYKIQGVPTLILFKKGVIKWQQSGLLPKHQLVQIIKSNS